jgi:hypothetical protein
MDQLALSPWLDPLQWTERDWAAIGVLVTLILALGTYLGRRRRESLANEPKLVFGPLHLHGPDEPVRPNYNYAIGFRLTNAGDAPATHVIVALRTDIATDDEPRIFSEVITRDVLLPGEPLIDHVGLRGVNQEDDPSEHEAREFFTDATAFAACWDVRGRPFLFFPAGGGRVRPRWWWWWPFGPRWPRPHELLGPLYRSPSRGEDEGSLGM